MENDYTDNNQPLKCNSTRKICYYSEKEAKTALNKFKKRSSGRYQNFKDKPRPERVYKCLDCGAYHLTKKKHKKESKKSSKQQY